MNMGASLAITIGIKENEHVGLTILMDQSKSKVIRVVLNTIIFVFSAVFYAVMIYYSVLMTVEAQWQYSQGLGITMILPLLPYPSPCRWRCCSLLSAIFLSGSW